MATKYPVSRIEIEDALYQAVPLLEKLEAKRERQKMASEGLSIKTKAARLDWRLLEAVTHLEKSVEALKEALKEVPQR